MPKNNIPPPVAHARARLANAIQRQADPVLIESVRAELAAANAEAAIRSWPPLDDRSRVRLAQLVLAAGDDRAAT